MRFVLAMGVLGWLAAPLGPAHAATPTADYTVVFDATWSEETHPGELPPGPHFSGLIGGLHNDQISFWTEGQLATPGISRMAEQGNKSPLDAEVNAAIGNGSADQLLSGGGIGTSPGSVSLDFTAHEDHPLMTLVSMLAPSPDWFVGVDALSLMNGNQWRTEIVVPLYVYDAGTDSGVSFTSADQDTQPPEPITRFETGFFAPPKQFVGSFTITRTDAPAPLPGLTGLGVVFLTALLGGLSMIRLGRRRN